MRKTLLRGRSMHPFLKEGDILLVKKTPLEEIKRGSVIAYKRDGKEKSIAHRVIQVLQVSSGRAFITKGDNVPVVDEPVHLSQVLGKVVMKIRKGVFIPITREREFVSVILGGVYLKMRRFLSSSALSGIIPFHPSRGSIEPLFLKKININKKAEKNTLRRKK